MLDELLDAATEVQETDYGYIATFEDARMSVSSRPRTEYPRVWIDDVEVPQPITSFAFWNVKAWYHDWSEDKWQTPLMERDTVDSVDVELIQDAQPGSDLTEAAVMVE